MRNIIQTIGIYALGIAAGVLLAVVYMLRTGGF